MMLASQIVATGEKVMPYWLVMTYLFHTFGELTLSPVGLSATTKLAPKRFAGQMMGMWFVASALGNLIAGQIAGDFNPINIDSFPSQYATIVLTSVGAGIILLIFSKPLKQLIEEGKITKVTLDTPGTSYFITKKDGETPITKAQISVGGVPLKSIKLTEGGRLYKEIPRLSFVPGSGGGRGAAAEVVSLGIKGEVKEIELTSPGEEYTSAPEIKISNP